MKLLGTPVGVTVLAAGVGNDVTGWILLALCVALVNNGSGLTALYVLLCCVGWILLLVFAVRPAFLWLLRRQGALTNGPSQGMVAVTLLLALTSAWFTGIVGVHPIFGGQSLSRSAWIYPTDSILAFLVGLICPHDGGFAIKVTEKVEDLVSVIFLPLYFALSGLSTNLGLLNDGITWAYVIGVITIAFAGKIIGGTLAARACKLVWRESFTIGVLMSCKGLVELIVLVSVSLPSFKTRNAFKTQYAPPTNVAEHWSSSQNPIYEDIYHFCRHGIDYHSLNDTSHDISLPRLVSKETGRLQERRD